MPDNKKAEEVSVHYVEAAFNGVNNVLPHIPTDDKGVRIDGYLDVYSGEAMTKETFKGKIPVQVKGTLSRLKNTRRPSREVSVTDLRRYLDSFEGVLYFVVYMDKKLGLAGIYYKQLLPYDIRQILEKLGCGDQKTVRLRFRPFPVDPTRISCICSDFLSNKTKQEGDKGILLAKGVRALKREGFQFQVTKTLGPDEDPFSLELLRCDTYLYQVDDLGISYVVGKLDEIASIEISSSCSVSAGDYSSTMNVICGEDGDGKYVRIGCFTARLEIPTNLRYADAGDFHERYDNARLLKGFCQTGEMYVDGNRLFVGQPDAHDAIRTFVQSRVDAYGRYVELLDRLRVEVRWDPAELDSTDLRKLDFLYAYLVKGKRLQRQWPQEFVMDDFKIGGGVVNLVWYRVGDGEYALADGLDPCNGLIVGFSGTATKNEIVPVPRVFTMSVDALKNSVNIDEERFADDLGRNPIEARTAEEATSVLLRMVKAYDDGANCSSQLLKCCEVLARAILEVDESNEAYRVNLYQVLKREDRLDEMSTDDLESLAVLSRDDRVRCSANALLGNEGLATKLLDAMGTQAREEYLDWPIAKYLRHAGK